MTDAAWTTLDHREVGVRLLGDGWSVSGLGEWATVWRSPDGLRAARVCPFEPGYHVFTELCRRMQGHPRLPRVDLDIELAGGGRLTVMEFLLPAGPEAVAAARNAWDDADPEVGAVRAEAERLDAAARSELPFWGGLDTNPGNVMMSLAGAVKLVDLFFASGELLYSALLDDPAGFAAAMRPRRWDFLHEINYIVQRSTPEAIAEIRRAAAAARAAVGER